MANTVEDDKLQNQIYILSGVFGGVCFFLVVSTIFLISTLHRLRNKVRRLEQSVHSTQKNPIVIQGLNADVGGRREYTVDELRQRGYSTYNGNQAIPNRPVGGGVGNGNYSDRYAPSLPPVSPSGYY